MRRAALLLTALLLPLAGTLKIHAADKPAPVLPQALAAVVATVFGPATLQKVEQRKDYVRVEARDVRGERFDLSIGNDGALWNADKAWVAREQLPAAVSAAAEKLEPGTTWDAQTRYEKKTTLPGIYTLKGKRAGKDVELRLNDDGTPNGKLDRPTPTKVDKRAGRCC